VAIGRGTGPSWSEESEEGRMERLNSSAWARSSWSNDGFVGEGTLISFEEEEELELELEEEEEEEGDRRRRGLRLDRRRSLSRREE